MRIGRGCYIPEASNHSLYPIKLKSSSYPEGNFGGNQLLDGSISLSPLYPSLTGDLHVSNFIKLPSAFPLSLPSPGIDHHLSGPNNISITQPFNIPTHSLYSCNKNKASTSPITSQQISHFKKKTIEKYQYQRSGFPLQKKKFLSHQSGQYPLEAAAIPANRFQPFSIISYQLGQAQRLRIPTVPSYSSQNNWLIQGQPTVPLKGQVPFAGS